MNMNETGLLIRDGDEQDALIIANEYWRHHVSDTHIEFASRALDSYPSKIAEVNGNVAGFIYCQSFAPDILEICNLFVNEAFRNRRIGSMLLSALADQASKQYSGLILVNSTLYDNPVVDKRDPFSLYIRHGFIIIFTTDASRIFAKRL